MNQNETNRPNLNHLSAAQLVELLGISNSLAGEVIKYRRLFGQFSGAEQLFAVPGITPTLVNKITDLCSFSIDAQTHQPLSIQLTNRAGRSYIGHHVTLNFSKRSLLKTPVGVEAIVWSGAQVAADCSAEGEVSFVLPADFHRGSDIYLRVFNQDGLLLLRRVLHSDEIEHVMAFDVEPIEPQFDSWAKNSPLPGEGLVKTLTNLVNRARDNGVQLINAPVY